MNVCDEEIQYILKFYYRKGKDATNAANKICAVYGPNVVSIRIAQMWFKYFKSGNFCVKDDSLSQIKSVPSLIEWSKIDVLVATTLLKN